MSSPGAFVREVAALTIELEGRTDAVQARAWAPRASFSATDGPVYVLIHGVGLSHRPYGRLARQLARHGRVIGLDLPGFGGLKTPPTAVSVGELALVVAAVMRRLNVERYIPVGHSMGAQVALELAILEPGRATGVVLIGPVVNPARPTLLHQSLDLARDTVVETAATNLMVLRDYLACGVAWYLIEAREMMRYRTDLRIRDLTAPLLVIRGGRDVIAPEWWCEWLARQTRGGASVSLPGHAHVVAHSDPHATAAAIHQFARSVP